ncbi:MAG: hypothetical protein ACK48V_09705 [Crocinitomicaceae bacterium]|jgi:hypothetical protein
MIKKYFYWSLACLLAFMFVSCNEDIDLSPDGKETAIVYALLDQSDSIHYVRVNRAFYGGTNALEIAQIPDSSYFKQVDVTISETLNGQKSRSWKLRDTIVYNKDTNGVFYAPKQKLYYFKTDKTTALKPGFVYKLNVSIDNKRFEVNGETSLIQNAKLGNPASEGSSFSFASNNIAKYGYFSTQVNASLGTASALNIALDIYIKEYKGTESTVKKINWNLGDRIKSSSSAVAVGAGGESFYKKIAAECTDKSVTKRQLFRLDINTMFCSSEFIEYLNTLTPSSSLAQSKKEYTNLTVSNGMRVKGIFASRNNFIVQKLPFKQYSASNYFRAIDQSSMMELCQGQYTGNLNFCSDVPSDFKETFFCK